jgi:ribosomal protein S18 acetylase RimI-like enzyme
MPTTSHQVIRCPRLQRADALKQLHDALPGDQRSVFAQVLANADPADEAYWDGVLVAPGGPNTLYPAVAWVQLAAGNTAVVWATPDTSESGRAVLRGAADFVDGRGIPLAQMVVGPLDGYSDEVQAACGFPRFAELAYLYAEVGGSMQNAGRSASNKPSGEHECEALHFVSRAGNEPQRLAAVLEQTYIGTLDCPALDGVRPMDEVLEGYRAQGRYSPNDWYFIREHDRDIGALLLTEHPGYGNWELVYMGVIPAVRGRGYGSRIIRFAQETTARRGAERLVLAVDDVNTPALRAYERGGFVRWDRRIVYARLRARA